MKKLLLCFVLIFMSITKIFSQNLVANGDFTSGNSGFTSDYQFLDPTNIAGAEGKYGITTNPSSWLAAYTSCTDHTSGSGNMMVVNGSTANSGNDIVWSQTIAVTPNRNYTFSYWVQTVGNFSEASLETLINSVSLGAAVSAPTTIVCGNWLKITHTWNSGASTSAQIVIYDRVITAVGNDFAIDDLSFVQLPTATVSGGNSVCLNSTGNVINFTGADGIAPYTFVYNINGGSSLSVTTTSGNSVSVPVPTNTVGPFNYNLESVSYGVSPVFTQNQVGTAVINVLSLPTATISGDAYVCSGSTGVINFSGTPNATVNYSINSGATQSILLDATGNASVTSAVLTASSRYELISVDSSGSPICTQNVTGAATLSVPTASIFGSTSITPGESTPITFFGTPGVTVNFTSVLGAASVVLNSSGVGYYNIPYLDTTTVFSLVSATVGACVSPLTGSVTITVTPFCSIAALPLAEVSIDTPQAVCNLGECTDLLARYSQISAPTNYTVCSIPYAPTFAFTGGTVIPVTGDDSWSPIVTLPFTFNFYGNCYNNVLVGTNGVITFDLAGQTPSGGCAWQYNQTIPNAGFPIKNAIYGVYQDTNIAAPPVTAPLIQNVNYYILDAGANAAPNRVFVANFNELPQFNCNNSVGMQTSQIVIHETTNIIEVLVSRRTPCNNWNPGSGVGNGVIGIQNLAGNLATVPPGRNTGNWTTNNEAWRFYPNAKPTPTTTELTWEFNGGPIGVLNENPLTICPTAAGTYTAVVTYEKCDGTLATVREDVVVGVSTPLPVSDPQDITLCSSSLPPYTVNIDQNAAMLSTVPVADQGNYSIKYYERFDDAKNDAPNNIDFLSVADLATYQVPVVPKTIYVRIEDLVTTGCFNIRSFVINVVLSPSGTFSYPGSPYPTNNTTPQFPTLFALTSGGTFSGSSPNLTIDSATGAVTASTSTPGIYTVTYDIPATALCPAFSTTATVEIIFSTCTVTASSSSQTVCVGTAITPITYTSSTGATTGSVPVADLPPNVTGSFAGNTFTISGTPTTAGTYTFTVTLETGATDTCSIVGSIEVKALPTATISGTTTICSGDTTTITFTGTPDATVTYNINGNPNVAITLDALGVATLITPALTVDTTYTLVSVASNGTPNCIQTLTGSAIITIKALPTASISGTATICSGDTGTITFTGTPNATVDFTADGIPDQITLDGAGTASLTTPVLTSNSTYSLVSVETNGTPNCSQTVLGSATITVKALPTASISGTTTICSGTTAVITFTGTANATVTYTDYLGANQPITLDAAGNATLTTPVLTADATYTLVSVASNGTPNCSQTVLGSATITVQALPTATISGTTTICSGDTATITFTGTANATVTYTDCLGTNQTITLDATGSATLITPVLTANCTYDLVRVDSNGTPNCGQTQTGSVAITVQALPVASISGTATICSGTTTNITFTGTPNATVTYNVNANPDEFITLDATGNATLATPILTADSTYTLVSVASNGTPNCSQTVLGSVLVSVIAAPAASISGATTICSGTTTTITFTGTPNATVTYTVDASANRTIILDATGTATLTTPILTADSTYDLVSVESSGTPSCILPVTGSVTITVKAIPTATIAGTTTICSGTTTNITFTGTPDATVNFTVDTLASQVILDATGSATITTPALTVNSTYALVSIDSNGTPNCSQTLTGSVIITIKALPTASIAGTTTICSGDTTVITFTGTPNATVTYTINSGANQPITLDATGTATLTTPVLTADSTYTLVSVTSNGIPDCSQIATGSAVITVNALPTASVTGDTICSGTTGVVTFTGTANATVTFRVDAGAAQTILLDAAGTAALVTPVLSANSVYDLISVAFTGVLNCSQTLTGSATVNVLALPTASISGTTQLCLNAPEPQITFTGANGQPPYTFTFSVNGGFPQNIITSASSSSVTLNVATTAAGVYRYDLISVSSATTPSCNQLQSGTATVTVLPLPTATISGNTTVCTNDVAPQITFTGANGQSPFTFTYTINGGASQNISSVLGNNSVSLPVSTLTAGTFVYALTGVSSATTPSCSQVQTGNATVVVRPPSTLNTTSTLVQPICISTAISPIVLNIGGSATGATVSGLPNGVSGVLNPSGTVLTISGTAIQTGTFNFVVTTTGGCAPNAVVNGTITVSPNATIVLTSGNSNQNLCINTAVTQIRFTTGNGATGASITAGSLPLGMTAIFSSGVMIISGTALESGNFNYVVSTTGGCSSASLSGVITVKPEVDLVLTSAPITTLQTTCLNTPITPIRYSILNGGTGATVTGLPTGITGVYAAGVFTISGATNQTGTFPYVVTTVGGCGTVSLNGSITINPDVTIVLTSPVTTVSQVLCINEPIVPITYELGSGATGAVLIAGTVPNGIQGSYNAITKIFTISGIAIESGSFAYTITTTGGCGVATLTGSIRVDALPVVALPQDGFICVDVAGAPTTQYTLTTNLSATQYGFEWSDINGVIAGETGSSYMAIAPGFYSVKVTNLATGCFDTGSATIVPSLPPSQVFTSVTSYFEDNQMVSISVTPPGDYLYQLDTGLFQGDNFFTNLFSGNHTVTVKDKYGCGTAQATFRIVNYPKFFTPNGDGYNDTWNIAEIATDQPEAFIYIFDRYGKLLKQISVIGEGWDGTLNGLTLPSTDYWFRVFYKENGESKEFKSHFSLKR